MLIIKEVTIRGWPEKFISAVNDFLTNGIQALQN